MKEYIKKRVHELYWNDDINCARTTIICLRELFKVIYLHMLGKTEDEIVSACYHFASAFDKTFGSLRCFALRPEGFSENDPPHRCENLTCDAIAFAYQYLLEITEQ